MSEVRAVGCLNEQVFCSVQSVPAGLCVQQWCFSTCSSTQGWAVQSSPVSPAECCPWGSGCHQLLLDLLGSTLWSRVFPQLSILFLLWREKTIFLLPAEVLPDPVGSSQNKETLSFVVIFFKQNTNSNMQTVKLKKWKFYLVSQVFPERSWVEEFSVRQLFRSSVLSLNCYPDSLENVL